jgi:hypothetical protein
MNGVSNLNDSFSNEGSISLIDYFFKKNSDIIHFGKIAEINQTRRYLARCCGDFNKF